MDRRDKRIFNGLRMWVLAVAVITGLLWGGAATADDVIDSINEGLQAYQKGEYAAAVQSLNYASQLIQQKKGEGLQALLPTPLSGWNAEAGTSQAAHAGVFGGGVSAERSYSKGESSVDVQIITDSPLMQGMIMMFSNPMIATSDGGKMEKIAGQRAIVKYNAGDRSGDIKIVVANRFLVSVEGSAVALEDLKGYAAAIDYQKLAAIP